MESLPQPIESEPKPIADPIVVIDNNSEPEEPISSNGTDTSQNLKDILLNLESGTWKEKAQRLNDMSVLTAKGKTWTDNNLRMAVKNLDDK